MLSLGNTEMSQDAVNFAIFKRYLTGKAIDL